MTIARAHRARLSTSNLRPAVPGCGACSTASGRSSILLVFAISLVIAGLVAAGAWWVHSRVAPPVVRPALTADARDYLQQIVVSDVKMTAADTPLGNTETYLDAHLTNRGARTVREIDLRLRFVDMIGQTVLEHTARPVRHDTEALQPGETRTFHLAFEHMPAEWNQAPPTVTAVYLSF